MQTLHSYDTVFITNVGQVLPVLQRLSRFLMEHWNDCYFEIDDNQGYFELHRSSEVLNQPNVLKTINESDSPVIFVFQNKDDGDKINEIGMFNYPDGSYPMALYFGKHTHLKFDIPIQEIYPPKNPDTKFPPYRASVRSPMMQGMTLVTPNDPKLDEFGKQLIEHLEAGMMS